MQLIPFQFVIAISDRWKSSYGFAVVRYSLRLSKAVYQDQGKHPYRDDDYYCYPPVQ